MAHPPPPPPPPGAPGPDSGYYPQQAYYAPGWTAPPPRRPARRTGLTVAIVLAITFAVLVAGVSTAAAIRWTQLRDLGDVTSPTTATARQVRDGHCIAQLGEDGQVNRVRLVPCSQPHVAEAVGTLPITDDVWPGTRSLEQQAARWCELDRAQQEAGSETVTWLPTERSWADGDRRIVCIVRSTTGPVTGSWTLGETPS